MNLKCSNLPQSYHFVDWNMRNSEIKRKVCVCGREGGGGTLVFEVLNVSTYILLLSSNR